MIKIVKITTQKKNKERYNVFIDQGNGEEYGFSIDQDVLIECQLRKGKTYNEEELNEILYKDEVKKAFNISLNYLSYRMRAEKEVYDYLRLKAYSEEIVNIVLQKLKANHYVNDLEFAKAFVRSRMATSTKGPLLIRQELVQKGINESNIAEGLKEFPEPKQLEIAFQYAEKNAKQKRNLSAYQVKQKIGQALLSKGFSRAIVDHALAEIVIEKDEEEHLAAVITQGNKALRKYSNKFSDWELQQKIKQYLYQRGFTTEEIAAYISSLKAEESL